MRRIWGKRGAGEMKGRKTLRRAGIVLAFGLVLCAGVMASGAMGMHLDAGSSTTDSTSTAADTTPPSSTDAAPASTDSTPTSTTMSNTTTVAAPASPTISSDKSDYAPGS